MKNDPNNSSDGRSKISAPKIYEGGKNTNQARETTITPVKNVQKSGGNLHSAPANNDYKSVRGGK